jgi:predicted AlkP superfamily phosphohydrolase/phosphomutase
VASDHGFGSTREIFYVNAWLAKQGYLQWKEGADVDRDGQLTTGNLRQFYEGIDWEKTIAYASTATSNGVYLRVARSPGDTGLPPDRYDEVRSELRGRLLAFRDAEGSAVVTQVVTREEAFPGKAMEDAPDLTLTLRDGGFVSIFDSDEIVKARPEVKGTHRPEGIFLANGSEIVSNVELPLLSILDVAPTLLHSLGLPIPENLEGECASGIFTAAFLRSQPVRFCEPTHDPDGEDAGGIGGEMERAEEEVVLDRLKALGYMQ